MKHIKRIEEQEDGSGVYLAPAATEPDAERFTVDVSGYLERWERLAERKAPQGVTPMEALAPEDIAAMERAEKALAFLCMAGQMHMDGDLTGGVPPPVPPEAVDAQDRLRSCVSTLRRMLDVAREVRKDMRPRKVRRLAERKDGNR